MSAKKNYFFNHVTQKFLNLVFNCKDTPPPFHLRLIIQFGWHQEAVKWQFLVKKEAEAAWIEIKGVVQGTLQPNRVKKISPQIYSTPN